MATGENEQALRKIIDLLRLISIVVLLLHYYVFLFEAFHHWGLVNTFVIRILISIAHSGLFETALHTKLICLGLLLISLLGAKGRKDEQFTLSRSLLLIGAGVLVLLTSHIFVPRSLSIETYAIAYITLSSISYLSVLTGGVFLSRLIRLGLTTDVFNRLNETFPQEERLIKNDFSINLPARYNYRGKLRDSWINIINPFRGTLIIGTPGAGKSYFVVRHVITQHIRKGFCMFIYDFKFDDLSRIAWNTLLKNHHAYKIVPKFYLINFDDPCRTHRCNPLDPSTMYDITDATESSRTIMLGLNKDWIKKEGDFFVESPINFVTAIIWFLKKYDNGRYCTLPHVIELMQLDYPTLFKLLRQEPEVEVLINPFESAFRNEAMEQLEGQIASAKIGMARLASPQLYYVLSENEFTLDINNPDDPKIVCMANNPQKQQIFGAALSLFISRLLKLVNKKGKLPTNITGDEFPTAYWRGIDTTLATARANKVAIFLAVQDYSQLKKDYGRDQAEVIMNIVGNVISGQVVGETSKVLSERFGKIVQQRSSVSVNSQDTSLSHSTQLDAAVPPSRIASLSSGEFVGTVADDPLQKIDLKTFHAEIINDHAAIQREEAGYQEIPVIRKVTPYEVQQNYYAIKSDIQRIVEQSIQS